MSKQTIDFGKFVADELLNSEHEEDVIVDLFIKFTKRQQKEQLDTESYVKSWIVEWLDLFPKGVKSGGKLLRSDKATCLSKMIKFCKDTGYDRDTIFAATREYLRERSFNDYNFTKCATYFINKMGEGSELAARCSQLTEEEVQQEETKFDIADEFFV